MTRYYFRKHRKRLQDEGAEASAPSDVGSLDLHSIRYEDRDIRLLMFAGDYITRVVKNTRTFYEHALLQFIQSLRLSGTYVDVGANIGNHTVFFAAFCLSTEVIAFEPMRRAFDVLSINTQINSLAAEISVRNIALADSSGHCSMDSPSLHNLGKSHRIQGSETPVSPLDQTIAADQNVALIKIDVEGDELAVLRGASPPSHAVAPPSLSNRNTPWVCCRSNVFSRR